VSEDVFTFHDGSTPLLISIPHDGRLLPDDIESRMTAAGRAIPDTDWHVAELYAFAEELGASVITARYSRYVVDLNRPPGDLALYASQVSTGICPERTFAGAPLYENDAGVDADEQKARVGRYWWPYHQRIASTLAALKKAHGYALLWDAHSIVSHVPALFDGELPVLNVGTWNGRSCAPEMEQALTRIVNDAPYTSIVNGRFTGGYITRHHGDPSRDIHAVQLELAQRSYMDERTLRYDAVRSKALIRVLRKLLQTYLESAGKLY
jgi:N-formylglutamate amidohydrolase